MHPSVERMWSDYLACQPTASRSKPDVPAAWHFCGNEADANTCARRVLAGVKRATSPSLWSFESQGEALPDVGDLNIVTDWAGHAVCVIRTTAVQSLPYNEITESHACMEGEGDGTLVGWRSAHWAYYQREREGAGVAPALDMPVVVQMFECVFSRALKMGLIGGAGGVSGVVRKT